MLIQRFPVHPFRTMDLLFNARAPSEGRRTSKPTLRLDELEDRFELRVALPGSAPERLELSVAEGWIELSASREIERPEGYTALRSERGAFTFKRRVELPKRVASDKVEAAFHDGILTVTLPKHATLAPRQITIKAA